MRKPTLLKALNLTQLPTSIRLRLRFTSNMKPQLYLLLSLSLSAAGCYSYEGPTTASGQVVDRFTGQPA